MKVIEKKWRTVACFVFIDQLIKLIIYQKYFDVTRIPLIPPIFYFQPTINKNYSWLDSVFNWNLGRWFYIISTVVAIYIMWLIKRYIEELEQSYFFTEYIYIFGLAGTVCALIDRVFWDGSLDYILLKGQFIFDLKDVYLSLMVLLVVVNCKLFKDFKFSDLFVRREEK